jgi:hypothetical protein
MSIESSFFLGMAIGAIVVGVGVVVVYAVATCLPDGWARR